MRTAILILCVAAMPLPLVAGLSRASQPELWLPGAGGNPADIDREVLWLDNPDFSGLILGSEVISAQDYWSETATDFVLEMDATIRKVTWWGSYYNYDDPSQYPTGSGFNLRFYNDADCLPEADPFLEILLPGEVCQETLAAGGNMIDQYIYEYCLELPLAAGVYWFSVQMADHEFPPQWGRLSAGRVQMCESATRSPYFGYPVWVPISGLLGLGEPFDFSQMFEDECDTPTAVQSSSWGAIKWLYR